MPTSSNSQKSLYPEVNIAYGSNVIYIINEFIAVKGISLNCDGSIKQPIIPDITGILNVFLKIGIFVGVIWPF